MLYRFPERVIYGIFDVHLKGLRPLYPVQNWNPWGRSVSDEKDILSMLTPQRSHSLQPTISWEQFPGSNVTYDLKVWRSGKAGPDALVYSRANLGQTSHTLEQELEPSTRYYWSVRAHFSELGREHITEWSRLSVKYSVWFKMITLGTAALMSDPISEGFYEFGTPPSPSPSP